MEKEEIYEIMLKNLGLDPLMAPKLYQLPENDPARQLIEEEFAKQPEEEQEEEASEE